MPFDYWVSAPLNFDMGYAMLGPYENFLNVGGSPWHCLPMALFFFHFGDPSTNNRGTGNEFILEIPPPKKNPTLPGGNSPPPAIFFLNFLKISNF